MSKTTEGHPQRSALRSFCSKDMVTSERQSGSLLAERLGVSFVGILRSVHNDNL